MLQKLATFFENPRWMSFAGCDLSRHQNTQTGHFFCQEKANILIATRFGFGLSDHIKPNMKNRWVAVSDEILKCKSANSNAEQPQPQPTIGSNDKIHCGVGSII